MEVRQFKVFMAPEVGVDLASTLYSGFIGEGPIVKKFENKLKEYLNTDNLLAVNSCTSALHLSLEIAKMKTGRLHKVITTPLTCFATTSAILQANMEPVWCDVDPTTCNMDLNILEKLLFKPFATHYAAIVIVHYAGYPVDINKLDQLLRKYEEQKGYRPVVVEDCAHALGSCTPDGMVGAGQYGNYCCHSFQAIKTLTTGDGGAIVLPAHDYPLAKRLRWFGLDRDQDRMSQDIKISGFKYQMNDLSATIGLANLRYLEHLVSLQRENVQFYRQEIPELAPPYQSNFHTSGWMYPVMVGCASDFDKAMKERGVHTGLTHKRNDEYTCVLQFKKHELPGVTQAEKSVSCIPSGWWLTKQEKDYIVDCIKRGW